jgi:hypothetical protein
METNEITRRDVLKICTRLPLPAYDTNTAAPALGFRAALVVLRKKNGGMDNMKM